MTTSQLMQEQLCEAVHQNSWMTKAGMQERLFSRLFEGLVYAQIWEDPVADMQALQIQPGDNLVCIASGGCNMMSYLTAAPASILAVDLSPAHVALNKLKLAAAQHLPDQRHFYALFAEADRADNEALFERYLEPHLDAQTRAFWLQRSGLSRPRSQIFSKGLYRYGVLGRFIGSAHILAKLAGVNLTDFLSCKNIAEQQAFFDNQIAPLFDHKLFRFVARQRLALFGLGIPPAQYEKLAVDGGGNILPVLKERARKLMCDFPLSDNYFAWQAFNRAYQPAEHASLPPYLQPPNFELVRDNASRVTVLNQSLTEVLQQQAESSQQCYVLLDAQDWMSDEQLNALWREISRTASAGARVIFRTGGAEDILPGRVQADTLDRWQYDEIASLNGFHSDRSAIYGGFHLYRFVA